MTSFDWNSYIFQIQQMVEAQAKRIEQLEEDLRQLKKLYQQLLDKPPVRIDKIEYKFDQLKVETLDGTLNIGLNPADLETIDELAVNSSNPLSPYIFENREALVQQIAADAQQYLMNESGPAFKQAELVTHRKIDAQVIAFVAEELQRQLPQRIVYYLDQTPIYDRTVEQLPKIINRVREKVFRDIDLAIIKFMEQEPVTNPEAGSVETNDHDLSSHQ